MSQPVVNVVFVLLGLAALAYVVRTEAPGRWSVSWSGAAAAVLTVLLVAARRHVPLASAAGAPIARWRDEVLVGGTALIELPYAGPTRIAGAAVWLLVWAALLHDSSGDDDERGPWVLALIPVVIMAVIFAAGPPGTSGGTGDVKPLAQIVGWLVAGYLIAGAFFWLRRRRTP